MSQEAAPERSVPEQPGRRSVPEREGSGASGGALRQREDLTVALSADLTRLDVDLRSRVDHQETEHGTADDDTADRMTGHHAPGCHAADHDKPEQHEHHRF